MANPEPRPLRAPKRVRRARNAAKNARWPVLSIRTTPEQAEAIRAAGGLAAVLQAVLAGDVMTKHQAEELALDSWLEAEEQGRQMLDAALDKPLAELAKARQALRQWEKYAERMEAALREANARAAALEARAPVALADQHNAGWQEGYAAGVAAGRQQEADRRAREVGAADHAQAVESVVSALADAAREKSWRVSWSRMAQVALREGGVQAMLDLERALPKEYRRRYASAMVNLPAYMRRPS
jgi:hypothetical protein